MLFMCMYQQWVLPEINVFEFEYSIFVFEFEVFDIIILTNVQYFLVENIKRGKK